jgi:hypothetical protein
MQHKTGYKYLLLLLVIASAACKKQPDTNATNSAAKNPLYSIQQGRVAFTSAAAYTQFLEEATPQQKAALAEELQHQPGYTPLSKSANAKQIMLRGAKDSRLVLSGNVELDEEVADILANPVLANMINSDGIVQIGNYAYNIDIATEKCYALHTSWLSGANSAYYYSLLYNGNANNLYVFEFTTEDEVLHILADNGSPTVKATNTSTLADQRCSGAHAKRRIARRTEQFPNYNPPDFVKCKAVYQSLGVYFALFGKIEYDDGLSGHKWQSLQSYYEWQFKPRCSEERVQPNVKDIIPGDGDKYKKYAWENSRGLAKYKIQFQWYVIGSLVYTQSYPLLTQVYAIQWGY